MSHPCPDACGHQLRDCCNSIADIAASWNHNAGRIRGERHMYSCPVSEAAGAVGHVGQDLFRVDDRRIHIGHIEPRELVGGARLVCDYGCDLENAAMYERVPSYVLVEADEDAICPGLFKPRAQIEPSRITQLEVVPDGVVH